MKSYGLLHIANEGLSALLLGSKRCIMVIALIEPLKCYGFPLNAR